MLGAERTIFALVLALGVLGARPAGAEGVDEPGATPRVRVTTAHGQFTGRLVAVRGWTIDLEQAQKGKLLTVQISRADILGLEVSRRSSRKGRGLAAGFLAGAGAAIVIGLTVPCGGVCASGDGGCYDIHCVDTALLSGLLTLPLGACLGYSLAPGEGWRPADVTELSLQPVMPRGGGVGIRLAIGF